MADVVVDRPQAGAIVGAVPRFATRPVLGLAAAVAVAHLAASFSRGYWIDEAYMLAIGRYHLDWSSADQPPVAPAIAGLMDWLAPDSIVALRLPPVLATAATVVVAALIARELGGDRRAQLITAGAQATGLWLALVGHWLSPYTLEPVEWLLLFWLVVRWLRLRDDRLLVALGVVVGIAAETKFQVLPLCAVLVLCVLLCGPRELLTRPKLWAGTAIAVALALPTLIWQALHGWPQLQMARVVSSESALNGGRLGIAVTLIVFAGVSGTVLVLYGLWRLMRAAELRNHRFLGATFLLLYVVFVLSKGHGYYLLGMYGLLAAAGAVGLQRRREAGERRWRWVTWPAFALSAAVAAGALVLSFVWTQSAGDAVIARRTAAAYLALPPPQRLRTVIIADSYIVASDIDAYSRRLDIPPVQSGNRAYGYYPPPAESQDSVLFVGSTPESTPEELRPYFTDLRKGGHGMWLCTGQREPWSVIWPRLRSLTVSSFPEAN